MRGDGRIYTREPLSPYFWCCYYDAKGQQQREVCRSRKGAKLEATEDNRPLAEKYLRSRVDAVRAAKLGGPAFVGTRQERLLVNELLDDLITEYKLGGKRRIPRELNAPMASHLKRLREYFGDMRAVNVRRSHLEEFITLLRSQGRANSTINRSLQLLSQSYAVAATADPPKVTRALSVPQLDESSNVRKGKFTSAEADLLFHSLPPTIADAARFAYETGCRSGELLSLRWSYLDGDAISVPSTDTKNRKARSIAITAELKEILARRQAARVEGSDLIFHHDGHVIADFRKCWASACVVNGLGKFYCRDCRDEQGKYISVLDAQRKCGRCGKHWEVPKFIGRIFHDFRRSACYEMWKAGSTVEECMEVSGHATPSMFKRYAELFTEEERRARQRQVQERRHEWRQSQASENLLIMPAASEKAQ